MSRTLVVTNDFPPRRGGIETWVRRLCDEHDPAGVVVHASSSPGDRAYDEAQPFEVVRDPSSTLLPTPATTRRVVATLRRTGADRVVFGASAPLGLMAPALRRAGARHLTALTHGHEVWWATLPGTRRLLQRIGDDVDELTYVSEYCRRRIEPALSPSARVRFRRLLPEVDRTRFRPGCGGEEVRRAWGIHPEAPVVVSVARMVRRKGMDALIEMWPEVRRRVPGSVLLLVGDGPDRSRLQQLARDHGVAPFVVFAGSVDHEEVPAHLDAGDVFALPCRTRRLGLEVEAFGIAYLEAAACGLRVAAAGSAGAREAITLARALAAEVPSGARTWKDPETGLSTMVPESDRTDVETSACVAAGE